MYKFFIKIPSHKKADEKASGREHKLGGCNVGQIEKGRRKDDYTGKNGYQRTI